MAESEGAAGEAGDSTGPEATDDTTNPPKRVSRREALAVLGATTVAGVGYMAGRRVLDTKPASSTSGTTPSSLSGKPLPTTTVAPTTTAAPLPEFARWSDPASWGGKVPGAGDIAKVTTTVMLDVDAEVAGVEIDPGATLLWDPEKSHSLKSSGNVIVHGALQMRPKSAAVQQVLTFVGIDEGRYTGGHTEAPQATDVGVWALHAGKLDLMGAAKTAWTHLADAAESGAGSIVVDDAAGWQVGDEIVVTPTQSPSGNGEHWMFHDRRVIKGVSGTTVTLDRPLDHAHPSTTVRQGVTHRAEVLNLTRNVRIEGTEGGNAHVMLLHNMTPQAIGYAALRYVGPQDVLGRYGLHFHMCDDGSRGSTIEGVVIYDSAHHAFVSHLSNGITWKDCLSHETRDESFWWDTAGEGQYADEIQSHDIVYERCVASAVAPGHDPHATGGFMLGAGKGNVARGCVSVGGSGRSEGSTGFRWSAGSNDEKYTWVFEDNITHNHSHSGLFFWQNNAQRTIVDRFTAYHCGQGMFAGAYINLVSYRDCVVYACSDWGLTIAATPMGPVVTPDETITYEGIYIDQAGISDWGIVVEQHTLSGDRVTKVTNGTFKGARKAQVGFTAGGDIKQMYDFVDCTFEGNAFQLVEGVPTDSQIRVLGGNLGRINVHPPGGPGQPRSEWNGSTTPA